MKKFIFIDMMIICICIFIFYGCGKSNDNEPITYEYNTNEIQQYSNTTTFLYKYINGFATFSCEFDKEYVICSDKEKNDTALVRWSDIDGQGTIISVQQVITADGKEIYNVPLEIIDVRNVNKNNPVWDYCAEYKNEIKVKCDKDAEVKCFIKMIDSNEIEYHVMLMPEETFNNDNINSAVYIIDRNNNKEFWYDEE